MPAMALTAAKLPRMSDDPGHAPRSPFLGVIAQSNGSSWFAFPDIATSVVVLRRKGEKSGRS